MLEQAGLPVPISDVQCMRAVHSGLCARIDGAAPCRLRFGDGLGIDDHPPDLSDYRVVGVAATFSDQNAR